MFTKARSKGTAAVAAALLAATAAGGGAIAGCGNDASAPSPSTSAQTASQDAMTAGSSSNPIPDSLLAAESGAEDTIDFALAGDMAKAIDSANLLNAAAQGRAATDLAAAGVSRAEIAKFQTRAAEVAKIAPRADPLKTALASNRVFELIAGFLGNYQDTVPADVIAMDYLDFEAKLQALAGDRPKAQGAVSKLAATWDALEAEVVAAGGNEAAASFGEHVKTMQVLIASGSDQQLADEAQTGLDLVDEIEAVYTG